MKKPNTVQIGDSFEAKTFQILTTILANDDFFVSGKKSKVFQKKGYYSEKRKSNIIFDITIETYLDNSPVYSILTIIECKNYTSPIPVNDIEEFDSKIRQISEHNIKGIIISNNSYQQGTFNFALSNGIGLVRITSDDEFEWIVKRQVTPSPLLNKNEIALKFQNEKLDSEESFIAHIDNTITKSLADTLLQIGVIDFFLHKEKFIKIPFVTEKRIDEIIAKLETYNIYTGKMLDENKLCSFLKSVYPVTFNFNGNLSEEVLGKIEFNPLKITLNKNSDKDLNRRRFTLAHEVGHLILHSKILTNKLEEKVDTDMSLSFQYNVSEMVSRRLEFQANIFASHLLLPISTLEKVVGNYFTEENIHKKFLYWDNQSVNQRLTLVLLNKISTLYNVSFEVARIRLIALGLLIDERYKSLKDILKELKFR